jgi:hypothetical protein
MSLPDSTDHASTSPVLTCSLIVSADICRGADQPGRVHLCARCGGICVAGPCFWLTGQAAA